MAYNTTGQSHKNGIKNELRLKDAFRKNPQMFGLHKRYGLLQEIKAKGGTKNKDDLSLCFAATEKGVSIKNNKGGSHDWLNTSKHNFGACKEWVAQNHLQMNIIAGDPMLQGITARMDKNDPLVKYFVEAKREELKGVIDGELTNTTTTEIRRYLEQTFLPIKDQLVIFSDKKNGIDYLYEAKHHPIFACLENPFAEFVLTSPRGAKTSRKILCDGKDTNLRFRLQLNNGVNALLAGKAWSANSSSHSVVKIQQDQPHKIINELMEQGLVVQEKIVGDEK